MSESNDQISCIFLTRFGLVRGSIPICDLPLVTLPSGEIYKEHQDNILGQDQTMYPISPSLIVKRLAHVEPEVFRTLSYCSTPGWVLLTC